MGIDPRMVIPAAVIEDGTEVWAEHVAGLEAWTAVSMQWRTVATGLGVTWIGLDAGAARAALDLSGLTVTPATWRQVETIAAGAAEELNR